MSLDRLFVQQVRSVRSADLSFSPMINIFHGENGGGKTSLLEAIHILSLGRSFRSRVLNTIITHGESSLTVGGSISENTSLGTSVTKLGVRLSRQGAELRINGQNGKGVSELTSLLPVVIFTPDTPSLIVQHSDFRRSLIDWGSFQSNPSFLNHWKAFRRVLKQRNASLRSGHPERMVRLWDEDFVKTSMTVSNLRQSYINRCQSVLSDLIGALGITFNLSVGFKPGWTGESLFSTLSSSFDVESKRGFSLVGAHRDDLQIKIDGRALGNVGSRGQIKLVAFLLRLVQVRMISETGIIPLFLLDDLPSEFDDSHLERSLAAVLSSNAQLFFTTVDEDFRDRFQKTEVALFHVKQGDVRSIA